MWVTYNPLNIREKQLQIRYFFTSAKDSIKLTSNLETFHDIKLIENLLHYRNDSTKIEYRYVINIRLFYPGLQADLSLQAKTLKQ